MTRVAPHVHLIPAAARRPRGNLRALLFKTGDLLFLAAVGIFTTLTMHGMHQFGWNLAITCLAGMVAAMVVQMLMAFCIAPLLGSIETMTPSMVIGMISPMSVCTLHMFGCDSDCMIAMLAGAGSGAIMYTFVEFYAARVRRTLARAYPTR